MSNVNGSVAPVGCQTSVSLRIAGRSSGLPSLEAARRRSKRPCAMLWLSVRQHIIISTPVVLDINNGLFLIRLDPKENIVP
jgi:hypothetical protein